MKFIDIVAESFRIANPSVYGTNFPVEFDVKVGNTFTGILI